MIRFACPSCQNVLEVAPEKAGTKLHCGRCNQRLQVPTPAEQFKTVLGNIVGAGSPAVMAAAKPGVKPAKESLWFYVRNGQRQGPVPASQLASLFNGGQVRGSDLVWCDGMTNWQPAKAVSSRFCPEPDLVSVQAVSHRGSPRAVSQPQPTRLPRSLLFGGAAGAVVGLCSLVALVVYLVVPKPVPTQQAAPQPEAPKEMTTEELVAKCETSVALIRGADGSFGSGFIVEKDLLVTNSHVVRSNPVQGLKIFFPSAPGGKTPITGELVYEDVKRDIAILRIKTSLPALEVAEAFPFKKGQKIVIIGSPGANASSSGGTIAMENAVTEGKTSTETILDDMQFYQVGATVNPGNSGGPMFDSKGRVVGVVVRKAVGERQEGMGFIIPLPDLQKALAVVKKQTPVDAEKTATRHDRYGVYLYAETLGDIQGSLLKVVFEGMQKAETASRGYLTGHQEVMEKEKIKTLVGIADSMLETLRTTMPVVSRDPELKPGVAFRLETLSRNLEEMNRLIHNPATVGYSRYATEANKCIREQQTQMSALVPIIKDELK